MRKCDTNLYNTMTMKKIRYLAIALSVVLLGQDVPDVTAEDFVMMQLCISEASVRRTNDCRAIKYITERRAAARGLGVHEYVTTRHTRHIRSPTRPWIGELDHSFERPESWPEGMPWDGPNGGREGVLRVLHTVQTSDGHGCAEAPLDWGGPRVDCANLQARVNGDWHKVDCGDTLNVFLARGHRTPIHNFHCGAAR